MGVSIKTAEARRANLMHKLDLHTVRDLIRYAIRHTIVEAWPVTGTGITFLLLTGVKSYGRVIKMSSLRQNACCCLTPCDVCCAATSSGVRRLET